MAVPVKIPKAIRICLKICFSWLSNVNKFSKIILDKKQEFDILNARDKTDCTPQGVDNSFAKRRSY